MKIKFYLKKLLIIIPLNILTLVAVLSAAFSMNETPLMNQLEGLNARQALALANQWYSEKQPVKTHITSKEVVFEFDNGKVKRIALPDEEMMVAVAPFIKRTHK